MVPIHKLLNRIRWDREFGKGNFEIGYYDRIDQKINRVPFCELIFEEGNHLTFRLLDSSGELHTIPFHRVREVYKDGVLIWSREH